MTESSGSISVLRSLVKLKWDVLIEGAVELQAVGDAPPLAFPESWHVEFQ